MIAAKRRCDALAFLAGALDSASHADRVELAVDALTELLPRYTGRYPFGDPGYVVQTCRENGITVLHHGRDGWPTNDWSFDLDHAIAAAWALATGEGNVERALDDAAKLPVPTLADVEQVIAHDNGDDCGQECDDCADRRARVARLDARERYLDGAADYAMDAAKDAWMGGGL